MLLASGYLNRVVSCTKMVIIEEYEDAVCCHDNVKSSLLDVLKEISTGVICINNDAGSR